MDDGTEVGTEVSGNTRTETPGCSGRNEGKSRAWFLTLNNPSEEEIQKMMTIKFRYIIFQHEVGEEGTPHIHACICYENAVVMPKRYVPRGHWERVYKLDACIAYCSKEETRTSGPIEVGDRPQQGRRTDLKEIAKAFVEMKEEEFVEEHPEEFIQYYRGLRELKNVKRLDRDRNTPPTVVWNWGSAGTGKTYHPIMAFGDDNVYMKDGTKWWDGYTQQECIVIDDFDGGWPFRDFLRLLDKYKYQGQVKGGYVKINSPFIYITCEFPPCNFWSGNELAQVERRLTGKVWKCWKDNDGYYRKKDKGSVECGAELS